MLSISFAIYAKLVRAYPYHFRQEFGDEMIKVFQADCRRYFQKRGANGLGQLWRYTLADLFKTILYEHLSEWRNLMLNRIQKARSIAYIGLIIPALFVIGNLGYYTFGITPLFGGIVESFQWGFDNRLGWLLNLLIIADPILAILISLTAVVEYTPSSENNTLASITLKKAAPVTYVVLGLGVVLMAILGGYFLMENWTCLIGQQISC